MSQLKYYCHIKQKENNRYIQKLIKFFTNPWNNITKINNKTTNTYVNFYLISDKIHILNQINSLPIELFKIFNNKNIDFSNELSSNTLRNYISLYNLIDIIKILEKNKQLYTIEYYSKDNLDIRIKLINNLKSYQPNYYYYHFYKTLKK